MNEKKEGVSWGLDLGTYLKDEKLFKWRAEIWEL